MINNFCYMCGCKNLEKVKGKVRDSDSLLVLKCNKCQLVFLSSFDHIIENYYDDSHQHDDPLEYRNPVEYNEDDDRRFKYCKFLLAGKYHLDFGCGKGGFLLKTQDLGECSHGFELEFASRKALIEKGIRVFSSFEDMRDYKGYYDIITMFHVLEHSPDPIALLGDLKKYLNPDGQILIEVPNSDDALLKLYNNNGFSNFYWSCHLFLFNKRTLMDLFSKAGFNVEYVQQIQRYSLSNHLYWLSNNLPGGHLKWGFIDSELINSEYANNLGQLGMCDTLIAKVTIK